MSELKTHDKSIAGDSNQAHFGFVNYIMLHEQFDDAKYKSKYT